LGGRSPNLAKNSRWPGVSHFRVLHRRRIVASITAGLRARFCVLHLRRIVASITAGLRPRCGVLHLRRIVASTAAGLGSHRVLHVRSLKVQNFSRN